MILKKARRPSSSLKAMTVPASASAAAQLHPPALAHHHLAALIKEYDDLLATKASQPVTLLT